MKQNNEKTNAFLLHICAFAGFIFPFGNIITPLIAWQTLKNRSVFLDEQGKEAVNFNISYTLYAFLVTLAFIPFAIGSLFSNHHNNLNWSNFNNNFNIELNTIVGFIGFGSVATILYLIAIALVIVAAVKAREGENYKYPFTIKFIK
ncbi:MULTISPECIES: DUF4870 domain-containing protein [unclassified Polaribacter]|uniref:DUF4870 domain-containing protein n=1 Tax=unclassified Polaribacter TaxID=196858 RepID=UPI0011BED4B2|nr:MULTISPECIES: DUF4870 domain-containing protein [unclassified Polaribacter]TXD51057.1 DUF4870 domain-containing protein [Polaribacter sp. IC063]TXD57938.1 DUF4870 domain-containing protein [Polaribacter sp. IC066]